jgi:hypothetical protein
MWSLYLVGGTDGLEVELCHSLNDIAAALDKIFPYERTKREELFARIAVLVDDLHLLDYCRLSGLAGTCRRDTGCACVSAYMEMRRSASRSEGIDRGVCVRVCMYNEEGVGRG